jgi:hypothetical protein
VRYFLLLQLFVLRYVAAAAAVIVRMDVAIIDFNTVCIGIVYC